MSKFIYDPFWFIGMCVAYSFVWRFIDKRLLMRFSRHDENNYKLALRKALNELNILDAELEENASHNLFMLILRTPFSQWSSLHLIFIAHRFLAYIVGISLLVIFFTITIHGHEYIKS